MYLIKILTPEELSKFSNKKVTEEKWGKILNRYFTVFSVTYFLIAEEVKHNPAI
jgi:hypothetical protein